MQATPREILTVGHSTRAPGELEALLREHGVELLVDVRAHPGSRRLPHFAAAPLERSLCEAGIAYLHVPELGGRRRPAEDSSNGGWQKEQFRGYADHMASEEFQRGLRRLLTEAADHRTCIMCAEATWWRCHRRLIADALLARGWRVLHVIGPRSPAPHELTDFAVVKGERVTYPPTQGALPGTQ